MTTIDAIPAEGEPPPIMLELIRDKTVGLLKAIGEQCLIGVRMVMDDPGSPGHADLALAEASRSRTQTIARSILKGKTQ